MTQCAKIIVKIILQMQMCFYQTFTNVFTATCFSNVAVMGSLDVRLSVRL